MKTLLSTLLAAGALVLGVMTIANANELVTLTDAQLDKVTAGGLYQVTRVTPNPYDLNNPYIEIYTMTLKGYGVKELEAYGYTVTHLNENN